MQLDFAVRDQALPCLCTLENLAHSTSNRGPLRCLLIDSTPPDCSTIWFSLGNNFICIFLIWYIIVLQISQNCCHISCKACWWTSWTLQEDQEEARLIATSWAQTCSHSFVFHFGESFLRLWINRQPLSLPETHRFLRRCPRRLRVPALQTLHDWLGPFGSSALSAVTVGAQGQHDEFSRHFNYAAIHSATHSATRPVRGPQSVDGMGGA